MLQCQRTADVKVVQISCSDNDRYLKPTPATIEAMKKSLQAVGQLAPIGVIPVTRNTYRVIYGATRFRAASQLRWDKIRVSIFSGTAADFEICELTENLDRREVTRHQRREMKARIAELQRQQREARKKTRTAECAKMDVVPAKAGRGKKGGINERARQEGIPRTTAQRRQAEAKSAHKSENLEDGPISAAPVAAVAAPAPAQPRPRAADLAQRKFSVMLVQHDFDWFAAWCDKTGISITDGIRRLVRELRQREQPKSGNGQAHVVQTRGGNDAQSNP